MKAADDEHGQRSEPALRGAHHGRREPGALSVFFKAERGRVRRQRAKGAKVERQTHHQEREAAGIQGRRREYDQT